MSLLYTPFRLSAASQRPASPSPTPRRCPSTTSAHVGQYSISKLASSVSSTRFGPRGTSPCRALPSSRIARRPTSPRSPHGFNRVPCNKQRHPETAWALVRFVRWAHTVWPETRSIAACARDVVSPRPWARTEASVARVSGSFLLRRCCGRARLSGRRATAPDSLRLTPYSGVETRLPTSQRSPSTQVALETRNRPTSVTQWLGSQTASAGQAVAWSAKRGSSSKTTSDRAAAATRRAVRTASSSVSNDTRSPLIPSIVTVQSSPRFTT